MVDSPLGETLQVEHYKTGWALPKEGMFGSSTRGIGIKDGTTRASSKTIADASAMCFQLTLTRGFQESSPLCPMFPFVSFQSASFSRPLPYNSLLILHSAARQYNLWTDWTIDFRAQTTWEAWHQDFEALFLFFFNSSTEWGTRNSCVLCVQSVLPPRAYSSSHLARPRIWRRNQIQRLG